MPSRQAKPLRWTAVNWTHPVGSVDGAGKSSRLLSALAFGVVLALSSCADRSGPGSSDLREALGKLEDQGRFTMAYRANGSQVVECFFRNRSFTLEVDRLSTTMVALSADGRVIASRDGDLVVMHRSLFAPGSFAASWIEADLQMLDAAEDDVLRRALGDDLAGYLLAPDLPASGEMTAVAAVEVAENVQVLNENDQGTIYRLTLDAEQFADRAAENASVEPSTSATPPPVIDVALDAVRVSRINVRSGQAEEADAAGWSIAFGPLRAGAASPVTEPAVSIDELGDAPLVPGPSEPCAVGVDP